MTNIEKFKKLNEHIIVKKYYKIYMTQPVEQGDVPNNPDTHAVLQGMPPMTKVVQSKVVKMKPVATPIVDDIPEPKEYNGDDSLQSDELTKYDKLKKNIAGEE